MSSAHALPASATLKPARALVSPAAVCLGGSGLQRGGGFVGRGGPCHQLRRRLWRSLAAVQRGRGADPSAAGHSDRAHPPHDQRHHRHRGPAPAGVDIPQHGGGTPGAHYRGRSDGAHLQRGAAGRPAGSVAAHRGQSFPCTRGLSLVAPGQYTAAAWRAGAFRALSLPAAKASIGARVRFAQLPLAITGLVATWWWG